MQVRMNNNPPRSAFTMIELVVVIMIILILMAFLFPAIGRGIATARMATVITDIKSLEKAIADFNLKYGMDPPSSFRIREQASDWNTSNVLDRNSMAIIRQIWPNFDVANTNIGDLDGNGNSDDSFVLNGAECLVFFLGGPGVLNNTLPSPSGFSTNPKNPFVQGGTRVGPFYEFDAARLITMPGRQAPSWLDPLPSQTMPYQYFSSYGGRGYQLSGYNGTANDGDDEVLVLNSQQTMRSVYLTNDINWGDSSLAPAPGSVWNQKTFQIISPGPDGEYGIGGTYTTDKGFIVDDETDPPDPFRSRAARRPELDNITNFGGRMTDSMFAVAP